jgi:hypothetical protein
MSVRVEDTMAAVQAAVVTPAREGMAVIAGLKAALGALRDLKASPGGRGRADDDDPLFIG